MKDKVIDKDTHFIIDGSTRLVKNESETKSMLVQYDHNSERFTFRVPRRPDDHDLSECTDVRVHFINIDKSKREQKSLFSDITDTLAVCPEDDEYVICSWLIPDTATQLAGSLHFVIQFAVMDGKTVKYSWNTAKYTNITISDGIKNDEETESEYIDILKEWEEQFKSTAMTSLEQTQVGDGDGGENIWTATFADGRTQELVIKNGSRGETGLVGSIETITGERLRFFTGTKEQYNNDLTPEQKVDLYALFTDEELTWANLADGTYVVGKAKKAKELDTTYVLTADSGRSFLFREMQYRKTYIITAQIDTLDVYYADEGCLNCTATFVLQTPTTINRTSGVVSTEAFGMFCLLRPDANNDYCWLEIRENNSSRPLVNVSNLLVREI